MDLLIGFKTETRHSQEKNPSAAEQAGTFGTVTLVDKQVYGTDWPRRPSDGF